MALETLKGVNQIGGFDVMHERPKKENGDVDWPLFDEMRKEQPIYIDHDVNMISFKIQNGPIKENGVNGCQVDALIDAARQIIYGLNEKFPCMENRRALSNLDDALCWLDEGRQKRIERGVEGYNKK